MKPLLDHKVLKMCFIFAESLIIWHQKNGYDLVYQAPERLAISILSVEKKKKWSRSSGPRHGALCCHLALMQRRLSATRLGACLPPGHLDNEIYQRKSLRAISSQDHSSGGKRERRVWRYVFERVLSEVDRLSGWLLLLCCHGSPQQFVLHSRRMGAVPRSSAVGKVWGDAANAKNGRRAFWGDSTQRDVQCQTSRLKRIIICVEKIIWGGKKNRV